MAVVKRPVTVDESEDRFSRLIAGEKAVLKEIAFALLKFLPEGRRGVAVMMKVHFDFAARFAADGGERCNHVLVILLDGKEEGVLWRTVVPIAKWTDEAWKLLRPMVHALHRAGFVGAVKRLEVIADRDEKIDRSAGARTPGPEEIGEEPFV
jgi:hypothetical protein